MAVKPIMNFVFQLKHLPKTVNKQKFIDDVLNVKAIEARRMAEDLGVADVVFFKSRANVAEAFTGVNSRNVMDTLSEIQKEDKTLSQKANNLVHKLIKRIEGACQAQTNATDEKLEVSKALQYFNEVKGKAKDMGIDCSDIEAELKYLLDQA